MRVAVLYSYAPQKGIIKGLKDTGYEVHSFFYGIENPSFLNKIYWKTLSSTTSYVTKQFNSRLKQIYKMHLHKPFDVLLIIKGKRINKQSKAILSKMEEVYKILWTTDSVERDLAQISVKNFMNKVFVQDGADIDLVKQSKWLPLGFDKDIFKFNSTKKTDILLFGNCDVNFYSKRLEYYREASKLADRFKVVFVGSNLPQRDKETFEGRGVQVFQTLAFGKFVDLVASSKVCVNIHQDDGEQAINPLFFAIPACGSIQITDKRRYYSDWLLKDKDYFEVNLEDLNNFIEKITLNFKQFQPDIDTINRIINEHSFHGRAKVLLEGFKRNN